MRIIKNLYKIAAVVLLLTASGMCADADSLVNQYFDKAVEELSGLSAAGTKPTKDWFETNVFTPIKALTDRTQAQRNMKDYASPQASVLEGYRTFVPSDTFTITQTGVQNTDALELKNNTSIVGNGYSSVIKGIKTTSVESHILAKIDADSNIVIRGVSFKHDTTGAGLYGLEFDTGIYITNAAKNVIIYECDFQCLGDGIYIGGAAGATTFPENVIIFGCTFYGDSVACNNPPCARNGVSITGGSNIVVANSTFYGFHNVGAIDIEPNAYDDRVHNVTLLGNTIKTRGTGIALAGGNWYNVAVTGNTIECGDFNSTASIGIKVSGHLGYTQFAYRNLLINNNTVRGAKNPSYGGIAVGGFNKGVIVRGNTAFDNDGAGILLSPGGTQNVIDGNHVFGNERDGIKLSANHYDSTSTAVSDAGMETNSVNWIDIGSPTTNERSTDYKYAGTYSRKIVADAGGEGLGQVLADLNTDSTQVTTYEVSAWVFLDSASTMTRQINMTVGNAKQVWEQENLTGPNQEDGRGWTRMSCIFYPSGTDTLKFTITTGGGRFYVDDVKVYRRLGHMFTTVSNNNVHDNNRSDGTYHAINLDGLMFSDVVDNHVSEYNIGDFDSTADALSHYWGIVLQRTFFSRILNNTSYGSQYADMYINDIYNSDISFIGVDVPFLLESSEFYNVSFPYAKALYFYEDSVAASHTAAPMSNGSASGSIRYPMPHKGRVVAIAAAMSDSVTVGPVKFYPQIGFQVNGSISSDSDKYITINGGTSQKITNGRVPILTGDVFNFNAGDYLGVSMATDGSLTPDGTLTATAVLMYE